MICFCSVPCLGVCSFWCGVCSSGCVGTLLCVWACCWCSFFWVCWDSYYGSVRMRCSVFCMCGVAGVCVLCLCSLALLGVFSPLCLCVVQLLALGGTLVVLLGVWCPACLCPCMRGRVPTPAQRMLVVVLVHTEVCTHSGSWVHLPPS